MEKVKIIFENENFIVVDKPSGLVVHSDGRTVEKTLVDFVEERFLELGGGVAATRQKNIGNPHTLDSGRYTARWGIVNRLDRETSGLILIAKNQETFLELQKLFLEKKIQKKYQALLWGEIDNNEIQKLIDENKIFKIDGEEGKYLIKENLTRHKKDPRVWVLASDENARVTGRDAQTVFSIEKVVEVSGKKWTYVHFFPLTGRTHQLRLHAKHLGHPILGDKKYSFGGIDNVLTEDSNSRLMLNAESLTFELFGQKYFFESKISF